MNLKPCPFCGKTEIIVLDANDISEADPDDNRWEPDPCYAVVCDYNNGGCGATSGYRESIGQAADAWNQRS